MISLLPQLERYDLRLVIVGAVGQKIATNQNFF